MADKQILEENLKQTCLKFKRYPTVNKRATRIREIRMFKCSSTNSTPRNRKSNERNDYAESLNSKKTGPDQQTKFEEMENQWQQIKKGLNVKHATSLSKSLWTKKHHERYISNPFILEDKDKNIDSEELNIDIDIGDCTVDKPINQSKIFENPFSNKLSMGKTARLKEIGLHPENVISESSDSELVEDLKKKVTPHEMIINDKLAELNKQGKPGKPQVSQKSAPHSALKIPMSMHSTMKFPSEKRSNKQKRFDEAKPENAYKNSILELKKPTSIQKHKRTTSALM